MGRNGSQVRKWPESDSSEEEMVDDIDMTSSHSLRDIMPSARSCQQLFSRSIASDKVHNVVLSACEKRFLNWVSFVDVFGLTGFSLDSMIAEEPEMKGLVLSMLDVLEMNLKEGLQNHAQDQTRGEYTEEELHYRSKDGTVIDGITGAIDRLHRLARMMNFDSEIIEHHAIFASFTAQDDRCTDENTRIISSIIQSMFPTAPATLRAQLTESVLHRHYRLQHLQRHTKHALGRDMRRSGPQLDEPRGSDLEREDGLCSDKQSVISNITGSPEPPRNVLACPGDKCDYCLEDVPFLVSSPNIGMEMNWRRHLDRHVCPYICISEDCGGFLQGFESFTEWKMHTEEYHGVSNLALAHQFQWECQKEGCQEQPFLTQALLERHLKEHFSQKDTREHMLFIKELSVRSRVHLGNKSMADTTIMITPIEADHGVKCPLCAKSPSQWKDPISTHVIGISSPVERIRESRETTSERTFYEHLGTHLYDVASFFVCWWSQAATGYADGDKYTQQNEEGILKNPTDEEVRELKQMQENFELEFDFALGSLVGQSSARDSSKQQHNRGEVSPISLGMPYGKTGVNKKFSWSQIEFFKIRKDMQSACERRKPTISSLSPSKDIDQSSEDNAEPADVTSDIIKTSASRKAKSIERILERDHMSVTTRPSIPPDTLANEIERNLEESAMPPVTRKFLPVGRLQAIMSSDAIVRALPMLDYTNDDHVRLFDFIRIKASRIFVTAVLVFADEQKLYDVLVNFLEIGFHDGMLPMPIPESWQNPSGQSQLVRGGLQLIDQLQHYGDMWISAVYSKLLGVDVSSAGRARQMSLWLKDYGNILTTGRVLIGISHWVPMQLDMLLWSDLRHRENRLAFYKHQFSFLAPIILSSSCLSFDMTKEHAFPFLHFPHSDDAGRPRRYFHAYIHSDHFDPVLPPLAVHVAQFQDEIEVPGSLVFVERIPLERSASSISERLWGRNANVVKALVEISQHRHPHLVQNVAIIKGEMECWIIRAIHHQGTQSTLHYTERITLRQYWEKVDEPTNLSRGAILDAIRSLAGLCDALAFLHKEKDICIYMQKHHITPDNILILSDPSGKNPRIEAKLEIGVPSGDPPSPPKDWSPTPDYRPPEIFYRKECGIDPGLWPIGCVTLEWLTFLVVGHSGMKFMEYGLKGGSFYYNEERPARHPALQPSVTKWMTYIWKGCEDHNALGDLHNLTSRNLLFLPRLLSNTNYAWVLSGSWHGKTFSELSRALHTIQMNGELNEEYLSKEPHRNFLADMEAL